MDSQPPRPQKKQRITGRKVKLGRLPAQKLGETSFQPADKILEQVEEQQQPAEPQYERRRRNSQSGSEEKILSHPTNQQREELETNAPQPFTLDDDSGLKVPYEFLTMRKAPIHTIIVPHFTWKSITFWMSVVMLVMFLTLVIVYASRDKSDVAWSCLMFETQNKFYPRLRYNYQFWRIPISALFHGNISHVVLNLIGLQIYGYFVEWYYGRLKYLLVLLATIINAHLLSCLTNVVSVSSTASGVLYAFIGLKIMFFIKYRNYKPLENRRAPIYSLFALIFAMNLVVLFVGSNVDVGGHVGGFITGLIFGGVFYWETPTTIKTKAAKYSLLGVTILLTIGLIAACFALTGEFYTDLNNAIDSLC